METCHLDVGMNKPSSHKRTNIDIDTSVDDDIDSHSFASSSTGTQITSTHSSNSIIASPINIAKPSPFSSVFNPPPKKPKTQLSIHQSFQSSSNSTLYTAIATAFAVHSLPHHLITSPDFVEMLNAYRNSTKSLNLPTRSNLRKEIIATGTNISSQILNIMKLSKAPISICLDGWTNVNRDKVTNIIPIVNNVAYYWTSIVNSMASNTSGQYLI